MMKMSSLLHPVSRFLIAFIFLASGTGKLFEFEQTIAFMLSMGFPAPEPSLVAAIVLELGGGLALLLGLGTRYAAAALILFVVPTTVIFHAWFIGDPASGQDQIAHTSKNVAIIGGLLKFVLDGGGRLSLDSRFARKEIVI